MPSRVARPTVEVRAEAVWERMVRLNLTQNGFARAVGRSSGYISLVLNGRRRASAGLRESMLRVLHARFDDLFYVVHPDESDEDEPDE